MTQPDDPYSPEQWLDLVNRAVADSGHGPEVITSIEQTPAGWRVGVHPVLPASDSTPPDAS